jgi:hypothetical protein
VALTVVGQPTTANRNFSTCVYSQVAEVRFLNSTGQCQGMCWLVLKHSPAGVPNQVVRIRVAVAVSCHEKASAR